MIVPDTKDWTWVVARPCPECWFDASTCAKEAVAGLIDDNVRAWEALVAAGAITAVRPDDATWSPLEYLCHVRDVYLRYDARIVLMLEHDDPFYPNWDQDASADEDRYDAQDPAVVSGELRAAASVLSGRLAHLADADWSCTGRRGDGASFTIDTISRYMIHDTIHHIWDVTKDRPAST
jgi:hypothetical protein